MGKARIDPPGRAAQVSVADVIAEMRRDAEAHLNERAIIETMRPDAMRPASRCEAVLAQVHQYWADRLAALLGPVPVSEGPELQLAEQLIVLLEQTTLYGPADRLRETASKLYNALREAAVGSRLPPREEK